MNNPMLEAALQYAKNGYSGPAQSQGKTDSAGTIGAANKTARRLLVTDVDPGLTTIKESL